MSRTFTSGRVLRRPAPLVGALLLAAAAGLWTVSAGASSGSSATLDQCTNGAVGPPVSAEQCAGAAGGGSVSILDGQPNASGYANWVHGNANGQKAHWQEGDFVPYRAVVTASAGAHTLVVHYDTVKSGGHAIDYLGSFDATETTATAQSSYHANYNTPCADLSAGGLLSTAACPDDGTVPTPAGSATVPAADFAGANCSAGIAGTWAGAQAAGSIKIFGPSGSGVGTVSYLSQNVASGPGQCITTMSIGFTIGGSGASAAVLAWGGHIASTHDWGAGNAATGIQGSPYHMALDTLDGTTLGNQDRALDSSAVFSPVGVNTVVHDAGGQPISGTVPLASVIHDTATLGTQVGPVNGTATYRLFDNATCDAGTADANVLSSQTVTVTNSSVPDSSPTAPLAAGSYGYVASFGDAASVCESFSVATGSSTVDTVLHNAASDAVIAVGSHVPSGTTVSDTNTVTPAPAGFAPGGTIAYSFFNSGDCSGTPTVQSGLALNARSNATGPLAAGSYGFEATWTGDSNYAGSTSTCESFTVDPVVPPTTTTTTTPGPPTAPSGGTAAMTPIPQATTVHTGMPFGGSGPYVVGALALGGSLAGLGLVTRRRWRARGGW